LTMPNRTQSARRVLTALRFASVQPLARDFLLGVDDDGLVLWTREMVASE
jgi:hypothetical protein